MECGKNLDRVPHMRLQLVIRHNKSVFCWNFNKTLWIVRDRPTLVIQDSNFVLKVCTLCVGSMRPKQGIKIVRAHTFVACIRNRSSLATFRNMADTPLLAKYVHGTFSRDIIHCWHWSVSHCFKCLFLSWCLDCRHIFVRKLMRPWPEMRLLTILVVMMTSRSYLALC